MKREIKFRAWYENKMHRVISYHIETGMVTIPLMRFPFTQDVVPEAVVEYTGLKDENGEEIYEGDIMKVIDPMGEDDNQCVAELEKGCYSYESARGFGDYDITSIGWAMEMDFFFEVIGNIYENPEL